MANPQFDSWVSGAVASLPTSVRASVTSKVDFIVSSGRRSHGGDFNIPTGTLGYYMGENSRPGRRQPDLGRYRTWMVKDAAPTSRKFAGSKRSRSSGARLHRSTPAGYTPKSHIIVIYQDAIEDLVKSGDTVEGKRWQSKQFSGSGDEGVKSLISRVVYHEVAHFQGMTGSRADEGWLSDVAEGWTEDDQHAPPGGGRAGSGAVTGGGHG